MADLLERQIVKQEKLENMIAERKQRLEAHEAGRSLLSSEEHEKVQRQIEAFGTKLEKMNGMTDKERSEMLEREMNMLEQIHSRTGAHRSKLEDL